MSLKIKPTAMDPMSQRGRANVQSMIPLFPQSFWDSSKSTKDGGGSSDDCIDLSAAENWLIRPELLEICRASINDTLTAKVNRR